MAIGELKMAKLRGKQKWKHCLNWRNELWALERELDSMSQKGLPVARQLGRVRSIILRTKTDEQKTMKPFINPAPNHIEREKREKKKEKERAKFDLHPFLLKEKESRQRKRKE